MTHGLGGYTNQSCRCETCRKGMRDYYRGRLRKQTEARKATTRRALAKLRQTRRAKGLCVRCAKPSPHRARCADCARRAILEQMATRYFGRTWMRLTEEQQAWLQGRKTLVQVKKSLRHERTPA